MIGRRGGRTFLKVELRGELDKGHFLSKRALLMYMYVMHFEICSRGTCMNTNRERWNDPLPTRPSGSIAPYCLFFEV